MINIELGGGRFLQLSNLEDYATTSDAVRAAAKSGRKARATKTWSVSDCSGPSWAHSSHSISHEVEADVIGVFSQSEKDHLFEYGHWYTAALAQGWAAEEDNVYGGKSHIDLL